MRRRLLVVLLSLETAIFCSIVASSLQLSQEISRSVPAHRIAHAVVAGTKQLAVRITQAALG